MIKWLIICYLLIGFTIYVLTTIDKMRSIKDLPEQILFSIINAISIFGWPGLILYNLYLKKEE